MSSYYGYVIDSNRVIRNGIGNVTSCSNFVNCSAPLEVFKLGMALTLAATATAAIAVAVAVAVAVAENIMWKNVATMTEIANYSMKDIPRASQMKTLV